MLLARRSTNFRGRIGSLRQYAPQAAAALSLRAAVVVGTIHSSNAVMTPPPPQPPPTTTTTILPVAPPAAPIIQVWNESCRGRPWPLLVLGRISSRCYSTHSTTIATAIATRITATRITATRIGTRSMTTSTTTNSSSSCCKIRLLYATSSGTSKLFAMELAAKLEEDLGFTDVETKCLGEYSSIQELTEEAKANQEDVFHFFLVSTTGVGDPTSDAIAFYDDLMKRKQLPQQQPEQYSNSNNSKPFRYAIFGCGNAAAHPNHFNAIGKNMQEALEKTVGPAILPLALGDDGDCIEDDFDQWQQSIVQLFQNRDGKSQDGQSNAEEPLVEEDQLQPTEPEPPSQETRECPGARSGRRIVSTRYPFLALSEATAEFREKRAPHGLMHVVPEWYDANAKSYRVKSCSGLNKSGVSNGLVELWVELHHNDSYEAGDHFLVYPRNPDTLVEAYMEYLNVKPHAIIEEGQGPHHLPKGLTLYETLSFCVDLSASPSAHLARMISNNKIQSYKEEVALTRRTVLDLALDSSLTTTKLSLEDFLHNATPMQPRYYSIASSPIVHVKNDTNEGSAQVLLVYRPVRYVTKRGVLRQGTCTSFMNHLTEGSIIVGSIRSNPSFRLPKDPRTSVVFVAGGCGVAPIRAFLEERLATNATRSPGYFGPTIMFLGWRDPDDVVYQDLIQHCLTTGSLTEAHITTELGNRCLLSKSTIAWECGTVTKSFQNQGSQLWEHFESGGHTYLCGGAVSFGAAARVAVMNVLQEYGGLSVDEATAYLQNMIAEGRFSEDLAG